MVKIRDAGRLPSSRLAAGIGRIDSLLRMKVERLNSKVSLLSRLKKEKKHGSASNQFLG